MLHLHINDQNTHQRRLPYLPCYTRNICKFGGLTLELIRKRMYSLVNVENY